MKKFTIILFAILAFASVSCHTYRVGYFEGTYKNKAILNEGGTATLYRVDSVAYSVREGDLVLIEKLKNGKKVVYKVWEK